MHILLLSLQSSTGDWIIFIVRRVSVFRAAAVFVRETNKDLPWAQNNVKIYHTALRFTQHNNIKKYYDRCTVDFRVNIF